MFHEIKQELLEERTARTKLQDQIDHMESEIKENKAQWKTELKQVTDNCMASNLVLEERIKRKRPELQSTFAFFQHINYCVVEYFYAY